MKLELRGFGLADWLAGASLAGLTWLMHGSAVTGWWRFDDSLVLAFVLAHPNPLTYFFVPESWRALGVPFFTPFLSLDFAIDRAVWGVEPAGFYARALAFVAFAGWLTFFWMREYVSRVVAWLSAAIFVCGAPTAVVVQQLMSRHYVLGLVFAITALMAWRIALERRSVGWSWGTCGLYLAAALCKEIYAPLPLVAFALDAAGTRDRLRLFWPWILTAVLFACWRAVMLGHWIGGHSNGLHEGWGWLESIALLPEVFWGEGAPVGALLAVLSVAGWLGLHWRQRIGVALAIGVAIALPSLASRLTLDVADWRLAFLPWWLACLLAGWALQFAAYRMAACFVWAGMWLRGVVVVLGCGVFLGLTMVHAQGTLKAYEPQAASFDVQGRYYWETTDRQAYVPVGHLHGYLHVQWALASVRHWAGKGPGPVAVPFLEAAPTLARGLVVHQYNPACRCMEIQDAAAPIATELSEAVSFSIERSVNALRWDMHALPAERCFWTFPSWGGAFAIPCKGRLHWDLPYLQGDVRLVWRGSSDNWRMTPIVSFPAEGDGIAYRENGWGRP